MPDDERREPSGGPDGDAGPDSDRGAGAERGPDTERGADAERGAEVDAGDPEPAGTPASSPSGSDRREVVVPMRLYKTVTVFSTLLAIVCILGGFVLLDRGTQRATASPDEVSLPVVVLGLALIVGGSAVYAFSTRFRTEGMGKPKDDTDEGTNNG